MPKAQYRGRPARDKRRGRPNPKCRASTGPGEQSARADGRSQAAGVPALTARWPASLRPAPSQRSRRLTSARAPKLAARTHPDETGCRRPGSRRAARCRRRRRGGATRPITPFILTARTLTPRKSGITQLSSYLVGNTSPDAMPLAFCSELAANLRNGPRSFFLMGRRSVPPTARSIVRT
jgi:hypothetical protein